MSRWVKEGLSALALVVALFAVPVTLIGYPVLANREDQVWMMFVGVFLTWVALAAFVFILSGGNRD